MRIRTLIALLAVAALSGCASTPPASPPAVANAKDQRPPQYKPQQVAPTAMEAWIAPWEDATGDLYPPSTVYIEVNPRSWQYGEGPGQMKVLRPLQVEQRQATPSMAPAPLRGAPAVETQNFTGPAQGA
jgi:conjugal transfer pilus assembly protein TraV